MRSILIVVLDISFHHPEQMLFIKDEKVIQTLAAHGTDEPFTNGISFGRTNRRPHDIDRGSLGNRGKMLPIFPVVVPDEILGSLLKWRRFAKLLSNPSIGWMTGNAQMDNASRTEFDDDKDEKRAKEDIGDMSEITCPDGICMITQKRFPSLARRTNRAEMAQIFEHRAFPNPPAQFPQLTPNTFSTPQPVGGRDLPDECHDLGVQWRMPSALTRLAAPDVFEQVPMPA
jgi:hypothetical protein